MLFCPLCLFSCTWIYVNLAGKIGKYYQSHYVHSLWMLLLFSTEVSNILYCLLNHWSLKLGSSLTNFQSVGRTSISSNSFSYSMTTSSSFMSLKVSYLEQGIHYLHGQIAIFQHAPIYQQV